MKFNQSQITAAIQNAEKHTSGEIQVYVTREKSKDVYAKAQEVFAKIGLGKTREKNAVLFFIAERSHEFAVLGDAGIHEKVHQEFWDEIRDHLAQHFKNREFTAGLCAAIEVCGQKLKQYFPRQADDVNELEDRVYEE